ncbi:putative inosine-uridine preferring nucleoside hydrolase [Diaporthe ampelina]|uniref:Putative inosine-uridine preferring nucleoside hydrolase n=1 Tax=Diaporthe ampelina TaxID=1214573 RepID=A0A0G2FK13_9PEZI|nr:putative inosine-uridine preferring nucleoside hydrolase [Diaporthe ampelina]
MTPRSVAGAGGGRLDFARQLAERNEQDRPKKKFRTSAPKGTKFADGYVDRAKQRQVEQEEDDKAARIRALEESLKKEEIDQATFEKLSNEIAGGDLSSTHLIKGLDFKLLERVRKGEDVFSGDKPSQGKAEPPPEEEDEQEEEDVDNAFEQLEEKEVTAIEREKARKKGQLATRTLVPGQKRTRDQILAEMKAAREAAKAQQESALGTRFKKIGAKKEPGSRIERDTKGREVLIIVDEDGNEKRKVRKLAAEVVRERESFKIDPNAEVLGMEVPEYYKKKLEEQAKADEDVTMFSDVESDYDPLGGISSDSDDSNEPDDDEQKKEAKTKSDSPKSEGEVNSEGRGAVEEDMLPPPKPQAQHARNYFKSSLISEEQNARPAMNDASVLAALKKAKTLNAATKSEEEQKEAERQERLKKMMASADRDAEDMDLGFGTNRLADEEELADDGKTKLSKWGDDDDGEDGGGGKSKRKRGPKKKKGDVNSVADVMKVLERRKEAGSVPVWLDADPGHDDVFAILLAAYHPGIKLLGISTVFGNAPLEKTTWNATSVLTAIGQHERIPIYPGASSPLQRPRLSENAEDIHGESGLDGTTLLPEPLVQPRRDVAAIDAAAAALRSCKPDTAWVVATGSLTNAAKLFQTHPDLIGHVKGLSLMGGAVGDGFTSAVYGIVDGKARIGNWTPWAEFNIIIDPEASAFIFETKELAAKTTILPLDTTHLVLARQDVQELLLYGADRVSLNDSKTEPVETTGPRIGKTVLRTMLVELLMFFAKTYKDVFGIIEGPPLHDPLAVAAVLTGTKWEIAFDERDPNSSSDSPNKRERFAVKVITEGTHDDALHRGSQLGRTIATLLPAGEEGVRIPRGLDTTKFWQVLEECVQRADEANAAGAPRN